LFFLEPELFEDDLFGEPSQPVEQIKKPSDVIIADDSDEDDIINCNNIPSPAPSFINSVVDEKDGKN